MSNDNESIKSFRKDLRWTSVWCDLMWFCAGVGLAGFLDTVKASGGFTVGNVAEFVGTLAYCLAMSYAIRHFIFSRALEMVERHVEAWKGIAVDALTECVENAIQSMVDDDNKKAQKPAEKASSKKDGADTVSQSKPASNAKKSAKKGK